MCYCINTDKRFGEQEEAPSAQEEKVLRRFQMERVKRLKKSAGLYNLDDSSNGRGGADDGSDVLTHHGQALSLSLRGSAGDDDMDIDGSGGEDGDPRQGFDDEDDHDGKRDSKGRKGGPMPALDAQSFEIMQAQAKDRVRSKQEVMHEVMMKAKLFRAEEQKKRAEMLTMVTDLDSAFDADLRAKMAFESSSGAPKKVEQKADADAASGLADVDDDVLNRIRKSGDGAAGSGDMEDDGDEFTRLTKELALVGHMCVCVCVCVCVCLYVC